MRRQRTKEEQVELLEGFESSNLSLKDYCKEKSLPPSTLRGWLKKSQNRQKSFQAFSIKVPDEDSYFCEILLGDKITIRVKNLNEVSQIKSLIESLIIN